MASWDWRTESAKEIKQTAKMNAILADKARRADPYRHKNTHNRTYSSQGSGIGCFIFIMIMAGAMIYGVICSIGGWSMDGGRPNIAPLAVPIISFIFPWVVFGCVVLILNASEKAGKKYKEEQERLERVAEFAEYKRIILYRAYGKDPEVIDKEFEKFHEEIERKKREAEAWLISLSKGQKN